MVTEIATVRIKQDELGKLDAAVAAIRTWIGSQQGFHGWRHYRSVETPELVTDVVEWETLEDATRASAAMAESAPGQAYGALMDEIVVFTHAAEKLVAE